MTILNNYRIYCQTEATYVYTWSLIEPIVCPNNLLHTINSLLTTIVETVSSEGEFDSNSRLKVNNGAVFSQFGEQRVTMFSPLFQNYALYNIINSQLYKIYTANGGTITGDTNGTELDISIGILPGSYAMLRSSKVCKYRPGYNLALRWNTLFDTPVANLLQFAGLGNMGSDIYFCYNGLDFGVRYSTDGYPEIRRLTVTSANTLLGTAAITLNGVLFTVPLTAASGNANFTAYQIANFSYTGWRATSIGNIVNFVSTTVGPKNGLYTYVSLTSVATFSQIRAGQDLTTTFINRTNWNGTSRMVQDLDPTKRNMYSINFSWYGSGNMIFKVFDPDLQIYDTVHTIKFANLQTEPSVSQPNMYLQQGLASLGSISAKTIRVAGGFGAIEGIINVDYPVYGLSNSVSIAANTETCILAIKNRESIEGFINNSEILIRSISCSSDGNKAVQLRVIRNPTTLSAGTTTNFTRWSYVNQSESISLVDTTSRTFTGGTVLATYFMDKVGNLLVDLIDKEKVVFKEDIIIFTALSTAISDIDLAVTIVEDY